MDLWITDPEALRVALRLRVIRAGDFIEEINIYHSAPKRARYLAYGDEHTMYDPNTLDDGEWKLVAWSPKKAG